MRFRQGYGGQVYADGHGPAYAYTPAGRLQSRWWVRVDGSGRRWMLVAGCWLLDAG
jgi:hypothetical protein